MSSKQINWRECTDDEKTARIAAYGDKYIKTKMLTGENKSRPGRRIRAADENNFITIKSE